jgi:hypothetical protein
MSSWLAVSSTCIHDHHLQAWIPLDSCRPDWRHHTHGYIYIMYKYAYPESCRRDTRYLPPADTSTMYKHEYPSTHVVLTGGITRPVTRTSCTTCTSMYTPRVISSWLAVSSTCIHDHHLQAWIPLDSCRPDWRHHTPGYTYIMFKCAYPASHVVLTRGVIRL